METDETANWQLYRSNKYTFEFKYPKDWEVTSEDKKLEFRDQANTRIISIDSINRTTTGITYCEANPQDITRCQKLSISGIPLTIDWNVDGNFNGMFAISDEVGLSVTLTTNPEIPAGLMLIDEDKAFFLKFLITFKFR